MSECQSKASRSAPRVAVVVAEAGAAKTHLIARFAGALHADGAAVLYARCDPKPIAPDQPFVDALDPWVEAGGIELLEDAQLQLGELEAAIPRLTGTAGDAPSSHIDRAALFFQAVVALLERIAAQHPLLLVIDDAQWADEDCIERIRHLIRSLDPERVTLVLGLDEDEAPGRPHPLLRELRREAELDVIQLASTPSHRPATPTPSA